jgi:uncharacterized protein DUF4383
MTKRRFAFLFGILFLLLGVGGFVPPVMRDMHPEFPPLILDANAGRLLGLFPVNLLLSGVHMLFGLWGIVAAGSVQRAKFYARNVGIIALMLTFAGFIPGLQNGYGLLPLYGNDIWLHGLSGLIAVFFGWVHRDLAVSTPASVPRV